MFSNYKKNTNDHYHSLATYIFQEIYRQQNRLFCTELVKATDNYLFRKSKLKERLHAINQYQNFFVLLSPYTKVDYITAKNALIKYDTQLSTMKCHK